VVTYSTEKETSVADEFEETTRVIAASAATVVFARLDWSPLDDETLAALTVDEAFFRVAVAVPLAEVMRNPVIVLVVAAAGSMV
jgi:hypothetical protein